MRFVDILVRSALAWEAPVHFVTADPSWRRTVLRLCAAPESQRTSNPFAEARTLYEWGRMHLDDARPQRAHGRLLQALAIFQHLGARPYIERTEQALQT